jgi:hypothetical protein
MEEEIEKLRTSTFMVQKMVNSWIPSDYQVKEKVVKETQLYTSVNKKVLDKILPKKREVKEIIETKDAVSGPSKFKKKKTDPFAQYLGKNKS